MYMDLQLPTQYIWIWINSNGLTVLPSPAMGDKGTHTTIALRLVRDNLFTYIYIVTKR